MNPIVSESTKIEYIMSGAMFLIHSEEIMKRASNISRDNLITLGVCFGKFTKSKKFKLHVTSLDYISQFAKYKIWIKSNGEMPYLYGNHCLKAHVAKMTEDTPEHQGVVIVNAHDVPLGFATTAKSALDIKNLDPTGIVAYHQTDVGEYLREEETLI